jgi:hypothetical protein
MAQGMTSMTRGNRAVSVDVGMAPVRRENPAPPPMCVLGISSPDEPLLAEMYPRCLVRDTRFREDDVIVEHVRLSSRDGVGALPGLTLERPSRIRDAVKLALFCGAPSVDVVLVRAADLMPWDLDRPEVVFSVDPFLSGMIGTSIVMPDIGGPISVGPGTEHDLDDRVDRFVRTVHAHSSRWVERYQVAFLDVPAVGGGLAHRVLQGASGTDAALCRWVGEPEEFLAHGWRSAGALVAGVVAARPNNLLSGLAGFKTPLADGRWSTSGRIRSLGLADSWRAPIPEDEYFVDVLPDSDARIAQIRAEPTMRSPAGSWSVASVRLAKLIHWRIMQAASRFVFEAADVGRAVALATAVKRAVEPYARAGVLVGPDGSGEPLIRGGVVRNPAAPGLRVEFGGVLLPWAQRVQVRVNLRPGGEPVIEEVE